MVWSCFWNLLFFFFVSGTDAFLFFCSIFMMLFTMYTLWYWIPIGYIVVVDYNFSYIIIFILHAMTNFCIGLWFAFIVLSVFVYIGIVRNFFTVLILDCVLILFVYVFFSFDYVFCFKLVSCGQYYYALLFQLGIYVFFYIFLLLVDSSRAPFDYCESESEIVCGIHTEFSGFFFVLFSLLETNHFLFNVICIVLLSCGGIFYSFKIMFFFNVFVFSKVFCCRVRWNISFIFICLYCFFCCIIVLAVVMIGRIFFF